MCSDRDEYLASNPELELELWQEWVLVVCKNRKIPAPDATEWELLRSQWMPGKSPTESVGELTSKRMTS